jgi:hypothetical protein
MAHVWLSLWLHDDRNDRDDHNVFLKSGNMVFY